MRVRMIRPAYWTDADLHTRLNADQREFNIGLWMLADDAGFANWNPVRIGADLYPDRASAGGRADFPEWVELLEVDHVQPLPCGRHLLNSQPGEAPERPPSELPEQART